MIHAVMALFSLAERRIEEAIARGELDELPGAQSRGVKKLALNHFSARYSRDPSILENEARAVFTNTVIARDGMEITIPFENED